MGEERIGRLLPDLYALRRIDEFPAHALSLVRRAVGGDKADYTEVDLTTGDFHVVVDPEPPELRRLVEARKAHMREHPVLAHFRRTSDPAARLISDFLTRPAYHRLGLYGEFFRHLGVEDQMTVLVSPVNASLRAGISVDRDRPAFEAADRRVLDALQPHLLAARNNALRFSAALGQANDGTAAERLTGRQRDVLAHVARGLTDAQIALQLDISPNTVRKHVEHILRRLGTPTRTAAAALYLTGGGTAPAWTASIASMLA